MDGKKRIAHLRALAKREGLKVALGFQARAGPKVLKVINPKPVSLVTKPNTGAFASAAAFRAALEKRGFKKLGEGHYSAVYGKDGYDKVIKVSRMLDNWIDYVAWASKNGYAGTFAPKVYSWKRFKASSVKDKTLRPWEIGYYCDNTDWSIAIVERMKETIREDSKLSQDFKIVERLHDLTTRSVLAELVVDEIVPGAGIFFKKLHKAFDATDIYAKNLMVRQDGSFCVTDPVCGRIKTEAVRLKAGDFSPPLINYWRYFESSS